jgi:hypothetical protein
MRKFLISTLLTVATLSTAACATDTYDGGPGYAANRNAGTCYSGERRDDCRERLRYEQQSHRRYVWRGDHYEDQDAAGAAIAGGIIGFILGTAIAGSNDDRDYYNTHRNDRDWRERCARAHPGFDPRTGTYVGQDGYRRYCTR